MIVYSETDWPSLNRLLEERTVLQTRLADLPSTRISDEATAPRNEAEYRLEELEKAITRIETGRYGICETCTTGIAHDRLEALPATRFCRDCA